MRDVRAWADGVQAQNVPWIRNVFVVGASDSRPSSIEEKSGARDEEAQTANKTAFAICAHAVRTG